MSNSGSHGSLETTGIVSNNRSKKGPTEGLVTSVDSSGRVIRKERALYGRIRGQVRSKY